MFSVSWLKLSFVYCSQTIPKIVQYNYIIIALCQPIWASEQIYVINMVDFWGAKMQMSDKKWWGGGWSSIHCMVKQTAPVTDYSTHQLRVNYWRKSYQHL